jgi:hypothetical protein
MLETGQLSPKFISLPEAKNVDWIVEKLKALHRTGLLDDLRSFIFMLLNKTDLTEDGQNFRKALINAVDCLANDDALNAQRLVGIPRQIRNENQGEPGLPDQNAKPQE